MATVNDIQIAYTPRAKTAAHSAEQAIPIEQRTDVTVDELERTSLPYPAELYDGKVVFKMANAEHGIAQANVASELKSYLKTNPIGYVMTETNFRLWPDRLKESRIPDVAFVKRERLPQDLRRFPAIAPDLAVEIISPDDNVYDMMNKVDGYLEQGTQVVWLVIPSSREVLVCTPSSKHSVRDVLTAPELLPGFSLPVSVIFEGLALQSAS